MATLPGLTFTAMQNKENFQPAFYTQLCFSFSPSFIHPFFLAQSYSPALSFALILVLTTLFSAALAGCRSVAAPKWGLPSGGPFVGTAFGGIKKGASTSPPTPPLSSSLLPPPSVYSTALSLSRPSLFRKEREREGVRGRECGGGIQKCENV